MALNRQQRRQQEKALKKKGGLKGGDGPVVTRENAGRALQAAVQFHQQGKLQQAENLYRRVLEVWPDNVDALNSLGMVFHARGKQQKAAELVGQALAAVPNNPGFHMNAAAIAEARNQDRDAEEHYRTAIALKPDYADPYWSLGDMLLRLKRAPDAMDVFDACMAHQARDYHALAYKAHALDDAGRPDDARYLLDFDTYLKAYDFDSAPGWDTLDDFNKALARHVSTHHSMEYGARATVNGRHSGELLVGELGPMATMKTMIEESVRWYIDTLPDDPNHPQVKHKPRSWHLTAWGVVMENRGHERAHIHPNGWLSGVYYVKLPAIIDDPARKPEGWIQFGKPPASFHFTSAPHVTERQPKAGRIYLFPSYFFHETIPFRSDERRICVAFDVEPEA